MLMPNHRCAIAARQREARATSAAIVSRRSYAERRRNMHRHKLPDARSPSTQPDKEWPQSLKRRWPGQAKGDAISGSGGRRRLPITSRFHHRASSSIAGASPY